MYFEVENTPERIKRAQKTTIPKEQEVPEEVPQLLLAPFSRPPQVFFENILVGTTAVKYLEILNPSKQCQQITLADALPPGLSIELPEQWLTVEPETCYSVSLFWTPSQATALRHTLRFTNNTRGRFDVIIILKTAVVIEKSRKATKKISPGKIKKKIIKKSPVTIYKKKAEIIYNTTQIKKTFKSVQHSYTQRTTYSSANKENVHQHYLSESKPACPFGSPNSVDSIDFDPDMFSNVKKPTSYKYVESETFNKTNNSPFNDKALKPSNKANIDSTTDIFDNLTFTPLKTAAPKDKLAKGPKIVISVNSESDFDDSLDLKADKENETHSIVSINTCQNKWLPNNQPMSLEYQQMERANIATKMIPNTSSPKDLHSPNFTLQTDFSRISDLSFFPQRHSTDKKVMQKINNETQDLIDDHMNSRLHSDTYTKESPNEAIRLERKDHLALMEPRLTSNLQNPKMCRQSLFRELQPHRDVQDNGLRVPFYETDVWHNEIRLDTRSPPRSITPPLQSIPEESIPMYETQCLDKSERETATFTINRTYDKSGRSSISTRNVWSKKVVKAEPEAWKVPIGMAAKTSKGKNTDRPSSGKISNVTFDGRTSNLSLSLVSNVYSQSLTVDPFLSKTYFFDEQAVNKFEQEFMRWLNCILTPPADLDSNVEQKVDVGKAWIENRNKEIPAAPTKEQVSSNYHNSHRLESLRRAARTLLYSSEVTKVLEKLKAQIDKKLIAIRNDKNLHLDVGLQKGILRVLLSYNPLWLRIGLEAIYGLVIPLRSNSDTEGLTTFIIQRMFKNPFLKNKHTKANAPNMLLPAYMEAIKKFTLKKFFTLVFFLDQAKERKLIAHDPCLFCRNAMCRESRDVLINFTKEVIAGIGDITKHLRPLGYVVTHKQSYIDEYRYAVNNIAVDLRDGVRITKVMEIILMKNNLLKQLRTPAISRLQKVHNVQVAFNALKEANFTINGEIVAADIADGHREKTLSFLWQLIHEFRAPLFEKAANVIQVWWRSKLPVILAKKREEELIRENRNRAATAIQKWWRNILFKRYLECQTRSAVVLQAYARRYLARKLAQALRETKKKKELERKINNAATLLQTWWRSKLQIIAAKKYLKELIRQRRYRAATVIQTWWLHIQFRRFVEYKLMCTIKLQAYTRGYLARKMVRNLREQRAKEELERKLNHAATKIQAFYRGCVVRSQINKYKYSTKVIQQWWRSKMQVKSAKQLLRELRQEKRLHAATVIQTWWLRIKFVRYLAHKRKCIVRIQAGSRGYIARKLARALREQRAKEALERKQNNAATNIQAFYRGYIVRRNKAAENKAAQIIQTWWRSKLQIMFAKKLLQELIEQRRIRAAYVILTWWKRVKFLQYLEHKRICIIKLQSYTRGFLARKLAQGLREQRAREKLAKIRNNAATIIQAIYRGYLVRSQFTKERNAAKVIQRWWRARCQIIEAKQLLVELIRQRRYRAVTVIQTWWLRILFKRYVEYKLRSSIKLQACTRGYLARKLARKLRELKEKEELERKRNNAAVKIQASYRGKVVRAKLNACRQSARIIQGWWRSRQKIVAAKQLLDTLKTQRRKRAARTIQSWWKRVQFLRYIEYKRQCTIKLQALTRGYLARKFARALREQKAREELEIRRNNAALKIQANYRGHLIRSQIKRQKKAANIIKQWWRVKYQIILHQREVNKRIAASSKIQTWWRRVQYKRYLELRRKCTIKLQACTRGYLARKVAKALRVQRAREELERKRNYAAVKIQSLYRGYLARCKVNEYRTAIIVIQKWWRAKLLAILTKRVKDKQDRAANVIQRWWRCILYKRRVACLTRCVVILQAYARGYLARKQLRHQREQKEKEELQKKTNAAVKIQAMYRGHLARSKAQLDARVTNLRRRWREGALESTQETLMERNEGVMLILGNMADIESVIIAVRSLELLTEVFPMMYNHNASALVDRVYICMAVTNRSISSIEVLKSAGAVLVNLARYKVTGPAIYKRSRVSPILKFMSRFASEMQLFQILCTYLWIFGKYKEIREDMSEFLNMPENHKIMDNIKCNVERMKRMETRSHNKYKFSVNRRDEHLLPDPEPDYGIRRPGKTSYFKDSLFAIECLFKSYNL